MTVMPPGAALLRRVLLCPVASRLLLYAVWASTAIASSNAEGANGGGERGQQYTGAHNAGGKHQLLLG